MSENGKKNMEEFQEELHFLTEKYGIERYIGAYDDGSYTLKEGVASPELVGELIEYLSGNFIRLGICKGIKMTIDAEDLDVDWDEVYEKSTGEE